MPKETITAQRHGERGRARSRAAGPGDRHGEGAGVAGGRRRHRPLLKADTPVMFVMNGIPWWYFYKHGGPLDGRRLPRIDPGDAVWNAVGPQRAIGSVDQFVEFGRAARRHPQHQRARASRHRRAERRDDAARQDRSPTPSMPRRATADVSARIRDDVWTKLLANLSSNPLTLSGAGVAWRGDRRSGLQRGGEDDGEGRRGDCQGARLRRVDRCRSGVLGGVARTSRASCRISSAAGRSNSTRCSRCRRNSARMIGVATPMLDLMVALMMLRAKGAGLYK